MRYVYAIIFIFLNFMLILIVVSFYCLTIYCLNVSLVDHDGIKWFNFNDIKLLVHFTTEIYNIDYAKRLIYMLLLCKIIDTRVFKVKYFMQLFI